MARIRTIKPEFPHSESMGRVSREARLCFILVWTLCDDCGRTRGSSRILASLLYPYDDDAKNHIDSWLKELERENCISRYVVDNSTYIEVVNWSDYQKIDRPSPSKHPKFDEQYRVLAKPREASHSLIGREGKGEDQEGKGSISPDILPQVPTVSGADALRVGVKGQGSNGKAHRALKRCPEEFQVTEDLRTWAAKHCADVDSTAETAAFRDYEFRNGHSDWSATWRNWMRKAAQRTHSAPQTRRERLRASLVVPMNEAGNPVDEQGNEIPF